MRRPSHGDRGAPDGREGRLAFSDNRDPAGVRHTRHRLGQRKPQPAVEALSPGHVGAVQQYEELLTAVPNRAVPAAGSLDKHLAVAREHLVAR